ncbi:MAG: hypothetical protein ACOYNR_09000 [Blastocatellia bacterium]
MRSRHAIWSVLLVGVILGSACSGLVKVEDITIPHLLTPISTATVEEMTGQLQPFLQLDTLRASSIYLRFDDLESAQRYRDADALLALQRPDKIRLVVNVPVVKTRIAEMVSEENRFRVAVYPTDYRRFLFGTNTADYSEWRARLGEKGRSALIAARPFHFTDALLIRPLQREDSRYYYSLEESLQEEPAPTPGAKKGARILRSYYVLAEILRANEGEIAGRVTRRFWFDRTRNALFSRQQIFDRAGRLETDVTYSDYRALKASDQTLWPGSIQVSRPYDSYQARLLFVEGKFETNVALPAGVFQLENTEGLPETDLDSSEGSPGVKQPSGPARAASKPARGGPDASLFRQQERQR